MKFIKKIRRYYKRLKLLNSAYDTLIDVLKIDSLDECCIKFNSKSMNFVNSCALDMGYGEFPKNPFDNPGFVRRMQRISRRNELVSSRAVQFLNTL